MKTFASATYHTRAIVLRVRNLGETDRVMTMLSEERGKFDATARGARRPKGKLSAVSQPFVRARFLIAKGRSIDIATQAEIENSHPHIAENLLKTAWATYCCELSSFLPEHLPEIDLFELLATALEDFDQATPERIELIGRWFEARYLALSGYAPQIGRCVSCDKKIVVSTENSTQKLLFSPSLGGTLCGNCASDDANRLTVSVQALRLFHNLMRGPQAPESWDFIGSARRDLHDCLRFTLAAHLNLRPKSQTFLDEIMTDSAIQAQDSAS